MELRLYWRIIRQRLWIIVGLVGLSALSYLILTPETPTTYVASMRFVVGVQPEQSKGKYYTYDRYYTWLTAEYLVDDLSEVVKSAKFASDVATTAGLEVSPGAIQGATSAGKLHRILTVSAHWHNAQELERIANAVVEVLTKGGYAYFSQLSTDSAAISLIDPPVVVLVGPSLRQRLDLPLRLALALLAGVAFTFLLDYLDTTIRNRSDVEDMGLAVLAEIPPTRGWIRRLWRRDYLP